MYKTIIIPVKCSPVDYAFLMNQNAESAKVWNRCVEIDKEFYEKNGRKIDFSELQSALLGYSELHRMGVYFVYRKYLFARNSTMKSLKAMNAPSALPNINFRVQKFYNTGWNYQGIKSNYEKGTIELCKKVGISKNGKRRRQKPVVCHAKTIPQNIVEIELLYRNGLKLAIKYKEPDIEHLIPSDNSAAIDLGEIHSITSIDNLGNAIIITGRKLRSIKRFRDKEQAKIRSKMSRCTKGSRQYKKYARAKWKLQYKADNQIKDAVHKTTKLYLDYCIKHNITTVYYGDLDACTRHTKGRVSTITGQKLNEWSFGDIVQQLKNKLGRYGIDLIKADEAYTSQRCPACGSLNKPINRNYRCKCGYEQHRDLVGAINLLSYNGGTEQIGYTNKKYLRIA
jgi:putative transposase